MVPVHLQLVARCGSNQCIGQLQRRKLQARQKPMTLRRFQASVGTALTSTGKAKKRVADHRHLQKQCLPRCPPDTRKEGLDQFPTWETRHRCKHCTRPFIHVHCQKSLPERGQKPCKIKKVVNCVYSSQLKAT